MSAADLEDSGPSLAQRVAALEAIVDRLVSPVILPAAPMTDEAAARFREEFEAAAAKGFKLRPLPEDPFDALCRRVAALERRAITAETALLARGDLTVNAVRAGLGLPEMHPPHTPPKGVTLKELRDLQLATGIITEEEHAAMAEAEGCRE